MPTSDRVNGGSLTKGTRAVVVYPTEYSGSNGVDRYLQGIECKTIESVYKYLAIKPQPIADYLKVRNGKIVKENRIFDDTDQETILRLEDSDSAAVIFGSNTQSGVRTAINHSFDRRDLGQNLFRHHDGVPYQDNITENPVEIMSVLDGDITFTAFSLDEHGFESDDAYLDPLGSRPIARNVLITRPYQVNGIKADIAPTDNTGKSIIIEQIIEKNSVRSIDLSDVRINKNRRQKYLACSDFFLDGSRHFGTQGSSLPILLDGFVNKDTAEILPFVECNDFEISILSISEKAETTPDDSLVEEMKKLRPSLEANIFDRNHISCTAGFMYNNCSQGTDSLAFGGLKK
jgi:hypothetical protein